MPTLVNDSEDPHNFALNLVIHDIRKPLAPARRKSMWPYWSPPPLATIVLTAVAASTRKSLPSFGEIAA